MDKPGLDYLAKTFSDSIDTAPEVMTSVRSNRLQSSLIPLSDICRNHGAIPCGNSGTSGDYRFENWFIGVLVKHEAYYEGGSRTTTVIFKPGQKLPKELIIAFNKFYDQDPAVGAYQHKE